MQPPVPQNVLPHRPPFLYVDEVKQCEELHIVAVRTFRPEEDFFRGHFPSRPVVPGVLLLEGLAQSLAYLALQAEPGRMVFLTGIDRARFRKPVLPGEQVEYDVRIESKRLGVVRAKGQVRVAGSRVADAVLSGLVVESP